jgi:hypothetical protein
MTTLVNNLPQGNMWGGRVRVFLAHVELASQAAGAYSLGIVPAGMRFLYGTHATDTSLGTSTVAVGISGATGKYKTAAVFTTTDTPTLFGAATAIESATGADTTSEIGSSPVGTGTEETILLTVATAALPASGNYYVALYFAGV